MMHHLSFINKIKLFMFMFKIDAKFNSRLIINMIFAFLKGPQEDLKSPRTDLREGLKNDKMSISTFGSIPPP